jgi:hypothetical protein
MLHTLYKSKLLRINPVFVFVAYAKWPNRPPLGHREAHRPRRLLRGSPLDEPSALRFSRDLISFSCRLLKNMPQNQSFVSICFGASDCSPAPCDILPGWERPARKI